MFVCVCLCVFVCVSVGKRIESGGWCCVELCGLFRLKKCLAISRIS